MTGVLLIKLAPTFSPGVTELDLFVVFVVLELLELDEVGVAQVVELLVRRLVARSSSAPGCMPDVLGQDANPKISL